MVKFLPSKQAMRVRFSLPANPLQRYLTSLEAAEKGSAIEKGTNKGTKLAEIPVLTSWLPNLNEAKSGQGLQPESYRDI